MTIDDNECRGVAYISQDKSCEHTEMVQFKTQIGELIEQVAAFTAVQSFKHLLPAPHCFKCNGIGHVQRTAQINLLTTPTINGASFVED